MYITKKSIFHIAVVVLLLIFATFLNADFNKSTVFGYSAKFFLFLIIYSGILSYWVISVNRRIMHKKLRFYLMSIGILLILLIIIRCMKYSATFSFDFGGRFLWYLFYFPLLFAPLYSLYTALYSCKPDTYKLNKKWYLLYLPTTLLLVSVLTNDLHQLTFEFLPGFENWNLAYERNIFYYIIVTYIAIIVVSTLIILFKKSRILKSKRLVWLPFSVLLCCAIYGVLYILFSHFVFFSLDMTAFFCIAFIAFWESSIKIGYIASNSNHTNFFTSSDIYAQILNKDGVAYFKSANSFDLTNLQFKKLLKNSTISSSKDMRLHMTEINCGYVVWQEDVSIISNKIEKLKSINEKLLSEVDMLSQIKMVEEAKSRLEHKKNIFNQLSDNVIPKIEIINDKLNQMTGKDIEYKTKLLMDITILGAYVKRRSNITLLMQDIEFLYVEELVSCFDELFRALKTTGAECYLLCNLSDKILAETAMLFYDTAEYLIEEANFTLHTLYSTLSKTSEGFLRFTLEMECIKQYEIDLNKQLKNKANKLNADINVENSSNTIHISVIVSDMQGGEL